MNRLRSRVLVDSSGSDAAVSVPPAIAAWFADLLLLTPLPFAHLVSDVTMLPAESLRVFGLDQSWLSACLSGAFSVGRSASVDTARDQDLFPRVLQAAIALMRARAGSPQTGPFNGSGFLLRSAVVKGWPDLEIVGYDQRGALLPCLRRDALSDNVLLVLFDGMLARFDLAEHPVALHFGFNSDGAARTLRYVTVPPGSDAQPGEQIAGAALAPSFRNGALQVLDVVAQQAAIAASLTGQRANDSGIVTSAEFALEMVEGVQRVSFELGVSCHAG